jgi:ribosome-associated heat shock protein Hsp15
MRLDVFLWWTRIVKKREWAQAMAEAGRLRIDGRPVAKAAMPVHVGQVLSFASRGGQVRAIRIAALPVRRGPAQEAQACYEDLLGAAQDKNVSQTPAAD